MPFRAVGILKSIHCSLVRHSHLFVLLHRLSVKQVEVNRLGYLIIADHLNLTQHAIKDLYLIRAYSADSKIVTGLHDGWQDRVSVYVAYAYIVIEG